MFTSKKHVHGVVLASALAAGMILSAYGGFVASASAQTESSEGNEPTYQASNPIRSGGLKGQIADQGENTVLARELVGATVYSPTDDPLGKVNDLIIGLDGSVEGAVIGVGGFMGFGEKAVAVEMDALKVRPQSYGELWLIVDATRQDLEAAPAFRTAAQQQLDEEAEKARREQAPESPASETPQPSDGDSSQ